MIRKLLVAAALAAATLTPAALAQEAKYSTTKNTVGELVKNADTKAVLKKYLPDVIDNPQLEQGYEMKFPDLVQYIPDLTPDKLKQIDADLAKVK